MLFMLNFCTTQIDEPMKTRQFSFACFNLSYFCLPRKIKVGEQKKAMDKDNAKDKDKTRESRVKEKAVHTPLVDPSRLQSSKKQRNF